MPSRLGAKLPTDDATQLTPLWSPTERQYKTVNKVFERMNKLQDIRDQRYYYFNDRSLVSTIDDCQKRYNGFVPPRDDVTMDWQSQLFDNFTRNVTLAYCAKVAVQRPRSKFVATNKEGYEDTLRAHILEKELEYSRNNEKGEWKYLLAVLECAIKGTTISYEGYKKTKRKVKDILKYDPSTGEVEYKEREILDFNDPYQEIIPLEDFYPGSVWVSDMQELPDCIWKTTYDKNVAAIEYKRYPNWKYVQPGAYTTVNEQQVFYKNKALSKLSSSQVEIIRYFNKRKDWYVIMANGILLYDGPFPWAHKKYPFAKMIYEPYAIDFFWGKSIPEKIKNDQDVRNTMIRMMVDQSYLSIYKPILTNDEDELETTVLVPGLVQKVGDPQSYRVLSELTGPDASHFQMFEMLNRLANDNSGNLLGGALPGAAQQKGRITAKQAMMIQETMQQNMQISLKYIEEFERDSAELRCKNILQFTTLVDKLMATTGSSKQDLSRAFNRVMRIDDTELTDGTYGTAIIRMVKDEKNLPSADDLAIEEEMAKIQGENVEIHVMTADYIRNLDFDVQIVSNSSFQQSRSLEQALGTEFYQIAQQNPLINQEENTREWIKLHDKDPEKMMKQQGMGLMPGQQFMQPGVEGQQPQGPTQTPRVMGGHVQGSVASQIKGNPKSITQMV